MTKCKDHSEDYTEATSKSANEPTVNDEETSKEQRNQQVKKTNSKEIATLDAFREVEQTNTNLGHGVKAFIESAAEPFLYFLG